MTPGPSLESRYQILRRLHVGGMAEVFLAEPLAGPKRAVAVKRMLPALAVQGEMRARFEEEAALLARLEGPGLPALLEAGADERGPYLVLQYIRGASLRELLETGGFLSETQGAAVLTDALKTLGRLHRAKDESGVALEFVHRDLAPENFQLDPEGRLWLLDLGLSKSRESRVRTSAGVRQGRLFYMAPEILRGAPATAASDLFSVAMVTAELVGASEKISTREDVPLAALLERLSASDAAGRIELPQSLSPEFRANLLDLLDGDPEKRPAPEAVLARLRLFSSKEGLAARVDQAVREREGKASAAAFATPVLTRTRPARPLPRGPGFGRTGNRIAAGLIVILFFLWLYSFFSKPMPKPKEDPQSAALVRGVPEEDTGGVSSPGLESARLLIVLPGDDLFEVRLDGRSLGALRGERELEFPAGAHTIVLTGRATSRYYREDFLARPGERKTFRLEGERLVWAGEDSGP